MSEHWYDRSGASAYETNGRPTTLRDARKLGLLPSVTTVLSVIEKPALITWMVKQGIEAVRNGAQLDGEAEDTYIARMLADSKAKSIAAALEGSKIHDACETYVKHGTCAEQYLPHASAARAELARIFPGVDDWVAEKSFAHPLGFGGKCDLHSPSTGIIADYKTKDGDFSDGKRLAYDQHWQLAAYQVGLGLVQAPDQPIYGATLPQNIRPFCSGAAIFISRTHPGCVQSHVWSADEMAQGWAVFEAALRLHQLLRNYSGAF